LTPNDVDWRGNLAYYGGWGLEPGAKGVDHPKILLNALELLLVDGPEIQRRLEFVERGDWFYFRTTVKWLHSIFLDGGGKSFN
jgi:hypothetical protein